jgi:HEAT repeat protein
MTRSLRIRTRARFVLLASLAGALMVAGGCAGGKNSRAAGAPTAAAFDPVAVSALRERALEVLGQNAAGPVPQLRSNALEAMASTPVRLEPLLASALRDENAGVRSTAAVLVGKAGLVQLTPAVRPLLNDPSPFVRSSAIFALAKSGVEVNRNPLAASLLQDPSARVRAHAAFLIGELGDPSALPMLKEAARTIVPRAPAAEVRLLNVQIAEAMVKLGDEAQLETIRAALYPSRPEELEATALAVSVIGHLQDRGSIDELVYLTAAWDEQKNYMPAEVRLAAAGSLARLGLRRGSFLADEYAGNAMPALRAQAAHVYGEIGDPRNLGKLEKMLADPEGLVRVSAAAAVVRIATGPAVWAGG